MGLYQTDPMHACRALEVTIPTAFDFHGTDSQFLAQLSGNSTHSQLFLLNATARQ